MPDLGKKHSFGSLAALPKRLCRELQRLGPTSGSGPLFADIEEAAFHAAAAAMPVPSPPADDFDMLLAAVIGGFRSMVDAPFACWPSTMTCAGTLSALWRERAAMFQAIDARQRIGPLPPFNAHFDPAKPVATGMMVSRGFVAIQRAMHKMPDAEKAGALEKLRPLVDRAWRRQLLHRIKTADDDAYTYALPCDVWGVIAQHLPDADVRTFSLVCRTFGKYAMRRWQRLTLGSRGLQADHRLVLPPHRFPAVRDLYVDFCDAPKASGVFSDLLAACVRPRLLSVRAKSRINLPPAERRLPVEALELCAVKQRGACNVFDSLLGVVDVAAVHTLRIESRMHPLVLSVEFIQSLTSLSTVYIDVVQSPDVLPRIVSNLPEGQTLGRVFVLDPANKMQSPLPRATIVAMLHAQSVVCRDADDVALLIDTLAHYRRLSMTDLCGKAYVDRLFYMDDHELRPVRVDRTLEDAQLLYIQLEADDDPECNDTWFAEMFPSLPLRRTADASAMVVALDAMDAWG